MNTTRTRKGIDFLMRSTFPTTEEWLDMIEDRVETLQPHFSDITLTKLGALKMMKDYFHQHDLYNDVPIITHASEHDLDLETRGIFPDDSNYANISRNTTYHRVGGQGKAVGLTQKIWGLTEDCDWITIEVVIDLKQEAYKYPGRFEEVARARSYELNRATLLEVCQFAERDPKDIWDRLGEVIKRLHAHHESELRRAKRLHDEVLLAERIIKLLPQPPKNTNYRSHELTV